jgi:hypothetical protein
MPGLADTNNISDHGVAHLKAQQMISRRGGTCLCWGRLRAGPGEATFPAQASSPAVRQFVQPL